MNHNSLRYLNKDDLLAMATYLKTVESEEPFAIKPSDEKPSLARGKQIYVNTCQICHQDGAMSAPRIGNSSNFYLRVKASGLDGLYKHTINGFNSMPVKGACVTCSDNDIKAAVDYILHESLTRSQWIDIKAATKKHVTYHEGDQ